VVLTARPGVEAFLDVRQEIRWTTMRACGIGHEVRFCEPGVVEDLASRRALGRVSRKTVANERFSRLRHVRPVLRWFELIVASDNRLHLLLLRVTIERSVALRGT
jgi:hypothetical protein